MICDGNAASAASASTPPSTPLSPVETAYGHLSNQSPLLQRKVPNIFYGTRIIVRRVKLLVLDSRDGDSPARAPYLRTTTMVLNYVQRQQLQEMPTIGCTLQNLNIGRNRSVVLSVLNVAVQTKPRPKSFIPLARRPSRRICLPLSHKLANHFIIFQSLQFRAD